MFIEPMAAAKITEKKRPDITYENGYLLEAKHDGVRAIISKIDGKVEIYTRVGNILTEHFPKIIKQIQKVPDGTILDGELMVQKHWVNIPGGHMAPVPDFNATMRIVGSGTEVALQKQEDTIMNFYIFDILRYSGHDWTNYPYSKRSKELRKIIQPLDMSFIDAAPEWGPWDDTDLENLLKAGIEGAILKHKDSLYLPGKRRANTWYKVKSEITADVVVTGFTEAKEGVSGKFLGLIGAIRFGAYNDAGELVEIGQCSGMTDEVRKYWTSLRDSDSFHGKVIEIKYNDVLATGSPRHPQYKIERLDKNPEDCLLTQFGD